MYKSEDKKTIILIEDDDHVRIVLTTILSTYGYSVISLKTGEEALNFMGMKHTKVSLIISDVGLPGLSGKRLEKEIKKIYPDIKILYISGYDDNFLSQQGIDENEDTLLLRKPFDPIILFETIKKISDVD